MRQAGDDLAAGPLNSILNQADTGYSSYSPYLPGCVSTGKTRQEVEQSLREAIEFHVDSLEEEGYPVPELQASTCVELPA